MTATADDDDDYAALFTHTARTYIYTHSLALARTHNSQAQVGNLFYE